jgi:outer membrane protein TolC
MAQEELSLERCRQMAVQKSETIRQADINMEKADAEKKAALTMYLPRVEGSATGIYLKDNIEMDMYLPTVVPDPVTGELIQNVMVDGTGQPVIGADGNPLFNMYAWLPLDISLHGAYMAGIYLEQPLFTGGKIIAGNKMAAIGKDMATDNRELQIMNTIVEADQAYWLMVSVKEKVRLAQKAVELLDSLLQRVKDGFETGLVSENDFLKTKVKYNKALLDFQKAKSGLELTRMSLCRITGLSFDTPVIATDSVIETSDDILVQLGNEDVAKRPEYKLMEKNIAVDAQKIKFTRADFLPGAGLRAGYNYIGGIEFGTADYATSNVSVMATLTVPIFHWGEGKQKINSARFDKKLKELEFEKNTQFLQLEIEQAKFNLRDAYTRIDIAEDALAQAEENLRVSKNNHELGRELMTDLLIAQTQWQEAYSELIDSKTDYKLKETIYLKVSGKLQISE